MARSPCGRPIDAIQNTRVIRNCCGNFLSKTSSRLARLHFEYEVVGLMDLSFSFSGRTERLIAVGRVVLASFSLLAIWLDPSEPAKYATLAYSLLVGYVVYALG